MGNLIIPPVPGGVRQIDDFGLGAFGSSRIHDRVIVEHLGVDLLAEPGSEWVCPADCEFVRYGIAYPGISDYTLSVLRTNFCTFKIFYVSTMPGMKSGDMLELGQPMGIAQNIAARYNTYGSDGSPKKIMLNHIHWEMIIHHAYDKSHRHFIDIHVDPMRFCE